MLYKSNGNMIFSEELKNEAVKSNEKRLLFSSLDELTNIEE